MGWVGCQAGFTFFFLEKSEQGTDAMVFALWIRRLGFLLEFRFQDH
jgi:hypothetical protein